MNHASIAAIVTILVPLSTFAQADDSENVIVIQQSVVVKVSRATAGGVVNLIGNVISDEHIAKTKLDDQLKTVLEDLSIDIDKRRSRLQTRFELLDLNEDDHIEVDEYSYGYHYRHARDDFWGWVKTFVTTNGDINDKPDLALSYLTTGGVTCHTGTDALHSSTFMNEQRVVEFDVADVNHDGQLSRDEFLDREYQMRKAEDGYDFAKLDSNQDRYIDLNEFMTQLDSLQALDSNQDGFVTYDELRVEM